MSKSIRVLDLKAHKLLRALTKERYHAKNISDAAMQAQYDAATAKQMALTYPDRDKLVAALDEVNGKATAHTYRADNVEVIAINAEERLERDHVTVANRPGTIVTALSGVPETKAYANKAHHAIATQVTLRRTTAAWVVVKVERAERWAGPVGGEKITTTISEAAKADIVKAALDGYTIAKLETV